MMKNESLLPKMGSKTKMSLLFNINSKIPASEIKQEKKYKTYM